MQDKHESYLIVGAGHFGTHAVDQLNKKHPDASLTVVDEDQTALDRLERFPVKTVCAEGVSYLEMCMEQETGPEWIIPAIPIHVAFEWIRRKLGRRRRVEVFPVPREVEEMLPNPKRGAEGQLFVSYADFRCPEHCTEPYDLCTWTGKPRKGILYKTIENSAYKDYRSMVVRSHQLGPGVGGYRPDALQRSLDAVSGATTPILYATACLCHGVIHTFRIEPPSSTT